MNSRENAGNKMNNMNKNKSSEKAVNDLLSAVSGKLGVSPESLKSQLESGNVESALKNVPQDKAKMLKKALSDKKTAEKILSSPQAQAIIKKLGGK